MMDSLSARASAVDQIGLDLTNNIKTLNNQIRVARGEASRVRVGVTFDNSVTLMVRNPQNIDNVASKNSLSLYFNTEDPNGFLAYVGPDKNSNAKMVCFPLCVSTITTTSFQRCKNVLCLTNIMLTSRRTTSPWN